MMQVSNLSKSYGERTLFDQVTFSLIAGERLGLVGRNGSGKSTLFRIILGEEYQDEGTITFPKGYRIGHLAQHLVFTEPTILKEACLGLPPSERDQEYRGQIILDGLGFNESDQERAPAEFSGGFQIRINLAKLLLSEPNLLLLDEPTNYLDIVSMRWLSGFLREWSGEMIMISHDRLFMDDVTTHSMLIHRGSIRKLKGPTAKLYERVSQDEEIYEKTRLNEEKKRKQLEVFINRFRAQASKATLVQSKILALERMGVKEELAEEENLDFRFCEAEFPGKQIAEVKDLSFNYPGGVELLGGLSFGVSKGDRIGVIGKNGKGKSTLLSLLAGELMPRSGSATTHQNGRLGYFGQTNIARLNSKHTVEEEVYYANQKLHRTQVRAICGTMMFSGDDALKKVSVLSGGEKSRVLLGKILAQPSNFLLLDEPTNHLDMQSIEALIESLNTYQGAVIIVTHSELILRNLATRLIVFQGETPHLFNHDYDYFLEKEGWGDEQEMSASKPKAVKSVSQSQPEISSSDQTKQTAKLQKKIGKMEERIYDLEKELKDIQDALALAYEKGESGKAAQLVDQMKSTQDSIEKSFAELDLLMK